MGHKLKSKDFPVVPFTAFLGIVVAILAYQYNLHGATLFVDRSQFDSNHTASEWHDILANKTVLFIGGPHRGGTTILWMALDAHPDISGLATFPPDNKKRECGEGILIQDVYPRHGIGVEDLMRSNQGHQRKMAAMGRGTGRYALADEKSVHLTESDERVSAENMAKLLNRYHRYWNVSKPVLVEKSPPNAVMSRFLQAMYNSGRRRNADDTSAAGLQTKFLFITRHPIANAYAHQSGLPGAYEVPFNELMDNYVQVHRYLMSDIPHLNNEPMLITLEGFAANPQNELEKIYKWLVVDSSAATVQDVLRNRMQEGVRSDPNAKYRKRWCGDGGTDRAWHNAIASKYQPLINELGLGYDLTEWCSAT